MVRRSATPVRNLTRMMTLLLVSLFACTGAFTTTCWAQDPSAGTALAEQAAPGAMGVEGRLLLAVDAFNGGRLDEASSALEAIATDAPGWSLAGHVRGMILIASGEIEEARRALAGGLGTEIAEDLAGGRLQADAISAQADPEIVYALAYTYHMLKSHRKADRLYRVYADLVGPRTRDAAKAFYQISRVYESLDASWGDPASERAKALALDPELDPNGIDPELPDLSAVPELAPYMQPIALAPGDETPSDAYDSLPRLVRWVPPRYPEQERLVGLEGSVSLRLAVAPDGTVDDVVVSEGLGPGCSMEVAAAVAAMKWRFAPAVVDGSPVLVTIVYEVEFRLDAPGPDSMTRGAAPDTAGAPERAEPDGLRASEPDSLKATEPDSLGAGGAPIGSRRPKR